MRVQIDATSKAIVTVIEGQQAHASEGHVMTLRIMSMIPVAQGSAMNSSPIQQGTLANMWHENTQMQVSSALNWWN